MTRLVPDPGFPGQFVNPDWQLGTPGTFAVVIGVSNYPHLAGGSLQVGQSYGLGQLHVSAATAHRFFRWLCDRYDFTGAPPARCWLLLSPTQAELAALGVATVEELGAAEATLANCEAAIGWWMAAMQQLPRATAEQSRGVFFFSGHGLEVWQEKQILLPADYLRPPLGNVNDAISTANLRMGLAGSPVPSHYLFVDACRNDAQELRKLNVDGRKILNEPVAGAINPDAVFGTLYAAASGTQTWQPRELQQGYSVFGGAVVDGLEGAAGVELQGCSDSNCEVWFYPLETFVKARMAQVLKDFQSQEKVRVRNGGTPPDGGITAVPAVAVPAVASATPVLNARYNIHHDVRWPVTGDPETGHTIFDSERITAIWQGTARAYRLDNGTEIPRHEIVVRSVSHSEDTGAFRVGLELPHSVAGHWLQFADATGQEFACALVGDSGPKPVYELEIDFELEKTSYGYRPRWVARVEARLSPTTPGPVGTVARIWETYQTHNAAVAAAEVDLQLLESAVMGKAASPLAAAVAATVLLRAGRLDLLHETWLRNLSDWFAELPDGPVLWAEQLRLSAAPDPVPVQAQRVAHLIRLTQRGLPRLAEVLPLAGRQLTELTQVGAGIPGMLLDRVGRALEYNRPGGLFAVFSAPTTGVLGPSLIR